MTIRFLVAASVCNMIGWSLLGVLLLAKVGVSNIFVSSG